MTYPSGPLQPVPLDGPAQRRRNLATAAGIVAVAGIVVAGMALSNRPARQAVGPSAQVGALPYASASASASAAVRPPSRTAASAGAQTSAPAAAIAAAVDVDGDGRPDSASTRFVSKHSAELVVRLATGKSLTSKPFPLYRQDGAGTVYPADVNGDHRPELLVSDPGADGSGYELFAYARPSLVEVAAPRGMQQPFLYAGGGRYYQSSFGCSGHGLVVTRERPVVRSTASLPPDPKFAVTATTYGLSAGRLTTISARTHTVANRAAAAVALARTANACGAQP